MCVCVCATELSLTLAEVGEQGAVQPARVWDLNCVPTNRSSDPTCPKR